MLGIYTGSALSSLAEVAAVTTAGDSNFTMASAGTNLSATAGTTYHIVVDSEVSATGASAAGAFRLSCIDSVWEFFGDRPLGTIAVAADGTLHAIDDYGDVNALSADGSRKWRPHRCAAGQARVAGRACASGRIAIVHSLTLAATCSN
jgi:hypothetical protein